MSKLISIVVLAACLTAAFGGEIHVNDNYHLKWEIDGINATFTIKANTTGWVGLGFNKEPKMEGAELIISGVRKDEVTKPPTTTRPTSTASTTRPSTNTTTTPTTTTAGTTAATTEETTAATTEETTAATTAATTEGTTAATTEETTAATTEETTAATTEGTTAATTEGTTAATTEGTTAATTEGTTAATTEETTAATTEGTTAATTAATTEETTAATTAATTEETTAATTAATTEETTAATTEQTTAATTEQTTAATTEGTTPTTTTKATTPAPPTPPTINLRKIVLGRRIREASKNEIAPNQEDLVKYLSVYKGNASPPPTLKPDSEWFLLSAEEKDGETTVKFTRKLIAGPTDMELKDEDIYVLWSYSDTDDTDMPHEDMGSLEINLFRHSGGGISSSSNLLLSAMLALTFSLIYNIL